MGSNTTLSEVDIELLKLFAQGDKHDEAAKKLIARNLLGSLGAAERRSKKIHIHFGVTSTAGAIAVAIRTGSLSISRKERYAKKTFDPITALVLRQLADDSTDKQIGLGNRNTGKWRVGKALRNMGARNRNHAVYLGFCYGLLK